MSAIITLDAPCCIDCKHAQVESYRPVKDYKFSWFGSGEPIYDEPQIIAVGCLRVDIKQKRDFITGKRVGENPLLDSRYSRGDPTLCGITGRWFETLDTPRLDELLKED